MGGVVAKKSSSPGCSVVPLGVIRGLKVVPGQRPVKVVVVCVGMGIGVGCDSCLQLRHDMVHILYKNP